MALAGPDFKSGFIDTAPVSNADIGRMVAAIMQLDFKGKGVLTGRVLTEAMRGGVMPDVKAWSVVSEPAADGPRTVLDVQARRHRWLSRPHPWAFTRYNHLRPMNSAMGQGGPTVQTDYVTFASGVAQLRMCRDEAWLLGLRAREETTVEICGTAATRDQTPARIPATIDSMTLPRQS